MLVLEFRAHLGSRASAGYRLGQRKLPSQDIAAFFDPAEAGHGYHVRRGSFLRAGEPREIPASATVSNLTMIFEAKYLSTGGSRSGELLDIPAAG